MGNKGHQSHPNEKKRAFGAGNREEVRNIQGEVKIKEVKGAGAPGKQHERSGVE